MPFFSTKKVRKHAWQNTFPNIPDLSIVFNPFTVRCRMNISILKIHVHFFSQKINPKITE